MILFRLRCADDHTFEAWFRDGATYDRQAAAGKIVCPECGGTDVGKAPMAPRLARQHGEGDAGQTATDSKAVEVREALMELRRQVEQKCDYVGPDFAEEARKIHYGEIEHRDIYGEASDEQARELVEEGVKFGRIPWLPRTDS